MPTVCHEDCKEALLNNLHNTHGKTQSHDHKHTELCIVAKTVLVGGTDRSAHYKKILKTVHVYMRLFVC